MSSRKARFITDLDAKLIKGDRIWKLDSSLDYYSPLLKTTVHVPAEFQTDFASVPRVPIAFTLYGNRAHREGVVHDYLFRKDSIPVVSFMTANKVFLEAMESRGKSILVRWPMYLAVCAFSYLCHHKRKVFDRL